MRKSTRNLVLAGLFIALGYTLPYLTGNIPNIGRKLLPMHIPVILAGYVIGGPTAMVVGFIVPILKSLLTSMPLMFPHAIAMAFELATYGLVAGLLYRALPRKKINILVSLIGAMIAGRLVWGLVSFVLYGIQGSQFSLEIFLGGALLNAIPGIIIQIILIPILVGALEGSNLLED